jgi:hypothetical protein
MTFSVVVNRHKNLDFFIFKTLPNVNNRLIDENSLNLITLMNSILDQ